MAEPEAVPVAVPGGTTPRASGEAVGSALAGLGPLFWISAGWLVGLVLAATLAPVLPLPSPTAIGSTASAGPSLQHLLGTDDLGRDLLSRLIFGARVSLLVGAGASALSLLVGGVLGLVAGYLKGATDLAMTTLANILLAFPALVFLLAVVTFLGPKLGVIIVTVGILGVAPTFRVVRSATLAVSDREFVTSAVAVGSGRRRVLVKEILPNVLPTVLAYSLVSVATAIMVESGLAFLGLSVAPPTPTWGGMVSEGLQFLSTDPWISLWPSIVLLLTLLSCNFLSDRLRTVLETRRGLR